MLVLALGTATPGYALDRVLETLLGAAIGLVVNLAIVPPLALDPARGRVAELTADTAAALDRLGDALLAPQNTASLAALLAEAREVRGAVAAAEQALGEARDSLALNPRGRRSREEVRELVDAVTRLSAITTQVTGMTRAFVDDYDVSTATDADVAAIAEQLHRAAHDLRLGAPGALTDEPPALTRPLELRTAPPQHWVLIGSLMVDMRRIHDALAARE